jgi:hypothetical protein
VPYVQEDLAKAPDRRLQLALLLALCLAAAAVFSASPALANYTVMHCTGADSTADGISGGVDEHEPGETFGPFTFESCLEHNDELNQVRAAGGPASGGVHWVLSAPEGTRFRGLFFNLTIGHGFPQSLMNWHLFTESQELISTRDEEPAPNPNKRLPANGLHNFAFNPTRAIVSDLYCDPHVVCQNGRLELVLQGLRTEVEDFFTPGLVEPVLPRTPLRGTLPVPIEAEDIGGGIANLALFVDGRELIRENLSNGGKCVAPYRYLVPCQLKVKSTLNLDTTALAEGEHDLQVVVTDVGGNTTASHAADFVVHNTPLNIRRPSISGAAAIGGQLTADPGAWEGNPTSFAFRWLRCPGSFRAEDDPSVCGVISGASGSRYVAQAADQGHRDAVVVTATNRTGSEVKVSSPSDLIATTAPSGPSGPSKPGGKKKHAGPIISHVTLSHKSFPALRGSHAPPRQSLLGFSSSKPGQLTIAIAKLQGKKKAKGIVKLAATIKAGRSSVPLSSRIGNKALSPGSYQLKITVRDAKGNPSAPAVVKFKVTGAHG